MSMTTFQEKDSIIQWCKDDGISCTDKSDKLEKLTWILEIGNPVISIYKLPKYDDRIFFQANMDLSPKQKDLLDKDASKKQNIMLQVQSLAIQLETNPSFVIDDDKNKFRVSLTKIHYHSSVKKADFLEKLIRVQNVQNLMMNKLSVALGQDMELQQAQESASSDNPLAG